MYIKITLRYHLTSVRMAITKKIIKYWWGCGEKNLVHYWWGYKLILLLWKAIWRFLKELQVVLPFASGYIFKGNEISISYRFLCSHVCCSIILNSQDNGINLSVYWYMNGKKMWYIHKVLFSFKTEEHPVTCYSKDESQGYYTKWNKPGTERQMVQNLIYMWILNQLNS